MQRRDEAEAFARHWIETWNRKDVDAMMAHFSPDVRFTSPKAAQRVGTATVAGHDALRGYWEASVALITRLHFTLDHILWDGERQELAIIYDAEINGQTNRACEFLRFGTDGLAISGEAMYGAAR